MNIRVKHKSANGLSYKSKWSFRNRKGEVDSKVAILVGGVFAIFLAFIFMGNLLPTSIGTMANATAGNAMKNVSAGDKALFTVLITVGLAALALLIVRSTGII